MRPFLEPGRKSNPIGEDRPTPALAHVDRLLRRCHPPPAAGLRRLLQTDRVSPLDAVPAELPGAAEGADRPVRPAAGDPVREVPAAGPWPVRNLRKHGAAAAETSRRIQIHR